jgi:superfamily II DNA/RNA helicase
VQEFNKGVYDYIIATDDSRIGADARPVLAADDEETELPAGPEFVLEEEEEQDEEAAVAKPDEGKGKKRERAQELAEEDAEESDGEDAVAEAESDDEAAPAEPAKKRKRDTDAKGSSGSRRKGKGASAEYGVSRGIDFVSVACVINFDLPVSARGYTHRIGRTARAGHTGTALSFVVPGEVYDSELRTNAKRHAACPTAQFDEEVWKRIVENQRRRGAQVKEWTFDRKQVESFRYRMEDALRSVTRAAIREARIKEIKQEILNSEKLKVSRACGASESSLLTPSAGTLRGQPTRPGVPAARQGAASVARAEPSEACALLPDAAHRPPAPARRRHCHQRGERPAAGRARRRGARRRLCAAAQCTARPRLARSRRPWRQRRLPRWPWRRQEERPAAKVRQVTSLERCSRHVMVHFVTVRLRLHTHTALSARQFGAHE